jgi:WD40 repeat protein
VTKVDFIGGKYLLAVSEDTHVQLMDLETQKVKVFLQGQHKCSVRNAAVDPQLEILATMGCDGVLILNKIEDQSKLKELKIADKSTTNYSN